MIAKQIDTPCALTAVDWKRIYPDSPFDERKQSKIIRTTGKDNVGDRWYNGMQELDKRGSVGITSLDECHTQLPLRYLLFGKVARPKTQEPSTAHLSTQSPRLGNASAHQ